MGTKHTVFRFSTSGMYLGLRDMVRITLLLFLSQAKSQHDWIIGMIVNCYDVHWYSLHSGNIVEPTPALSGEANSGIHTAHSTFQTFASKYFH